MLSVRGLAAQGRFSDSVLRFAQVNAWVLPVLVVRENCSGDAIVGLINPDSGEVDVEAPGPAWASRPGDRPGCGLLARGSPGEGFRPERLSKRT